MIKHTYILEDLPEVATFILNNVETKSVLFYGAMGVGKTTLIKALAQKLQVKDTISSPTFSIVNEYEAADDLLYHFDFYRIENEEEALDIGVEEYFDSGKWVFVEWPERIATILPEKADRIYLSNNKNGSRTLKINPN